MKYRWFAVPLAGALLSGAVYAQQAYPNRPIRLVIPYAPGGPVDIVGRVTGLKLTEALGQQVIIDNRAGAGGNIALDIVAKATPDGYTLLMGANGPIAINPSLYPNMPVDTGKRSGAISMVASSAMILVAHPSVPAGSVRELVALAKAQAGQHQLRLLRQRLHCAPVERALQEHGGRRHGARALQRCGTRAHRSRRRPGSDHVHRCFIDAAVREERQIESARRLQ